MEKMGGENEVVNQKKRLVYDDEVLPEVDDL